MITLYRGIYQKFRNKIKLRRAVKEIKYSSSGVEVTTSRGEVYTADYAICTFSTGVLASDLVTFNPPLPEWKREAILKMPMSIFTKIFLKFPYKFWDDNEFVMHAASQRGYFPVFQNLAKKGFFPGSGLMLMVVTEDVARRIENQSFRKTRAEIYKMLKKVYGKYIPAPTNIFYPRWSRNPFFRGSYCDPVLGTTEEDMTNLGRNVENLYFGGDATTEWFGFMQGAYISGVNNGKIVSNLVKNGSPVV
ncbi:polyamine oxidase 1-like [Actinia tenebrosa]|uniref:Polyamine oxidase 1-like n=1 Tax=Actinia tenebrosa TaxID=6105 RepID=A0A6P8J550_ACTTE|nr:polyamine oxidase 1-like [Actinia tenebrosa]